ncbi:thioesterase family protein [Gordonia zhaorongruii]|uniref:thioesterase family protein n=1 Tax=Gordonia zhaorongruii TaxID=2597659 RepID=UPI00104A2BC4|nr:thioesterase family protein [Gordonia zhaorongruii]
MLSSAAAAPGYYEPISVPGGADPGYEYFQPTGATVSVWSPDIQHGAPPAALMVGAMQRAAPEDGQVFTRITTEILGGIGLGVNRVRTAIPRPGRRISMVTADLEVLGADGEFRLVARTSGWRMIVNDSSPAAAAPRPPLPALPDDLQQIEGFPLDGDDAVPWGREGYIGTTVTARQDGRNGTTPAIWIRAGVPLIVGREMTHLEAIFAVIDVANGVGTQLDPRDWTWMNLDTTVHLVAQPSSPWVGIDADLAIGRDGYGASFADLYDVAGFLGRSAQTDMIAPAG